MKKMVALDRDGTLNVDNGYFHDASKLEIIDGVVEGLQKLNDFVLVVVSNQSGIGDGVHTEQDTIDVNNKINEVLGENGVKIHKFYYCPHAIRGGCSCRKPKTEIFEKAASELGIDMNQSWFIGDKTSDIKTGENLQEKYPGFKSIRVLTGSRDSDYDVTPVLEARNMIEAADFIVKKLAENI